LLFNSRVIEVGLPGDENHRLLKLATPFTVDSE